MLEILATLHHEMVARLQALDNPIERETHFIEMKDKISVAIGMRRTGKTMLMYQKIRSLLQEGVMLEQILYIDFEDDRLLPVTQQTLSGLIENFFSLFPENHDRLCYLFLDEIQMVDHWALVVRRFHQTKQVKIYLSGSSAKLLSTEISTELRGRSIATEVFPFSFLEYLKYFMHEPLSPPFAKPIQDNLMTHFRAYLASGGFPGVCIETPLNRTRILQEYVNTVLFRDIVERHHITHLELIKYLLHYALKNHATCLSTHKIYNDLKSQGFKIGRSTVYEYLAFLEDAYLLFTVPLFSESIRKMQSNPRKLYAIDNGLVNANSLQLTSNYGRAFENLFYLDLRRQGAEIYYYLTQARYEVDFVTKNAMGDWHLYQICYDASSPKTLEREQLALALAEDELGIKGHIITMENYLNWITGS